MSADGSQLQLVASQSTANIALIPCTVGWCIQLYLCGVSTDRARRMLYHRKYQETKASGVPGTRYFLLAALLMNLAYTIVTIWDIVAWVAEQDRTDDGVGGLKVPDIVGPFMGGLVGIIVPTFMAIRCWRITNRSIVFAVTISALLLLSLVGLFWVLVWSAKFYLGQLGDELLFIPNQIWLFTNAVIDTVITICLIVHLKRMKRGFNTTTDNFLDSLTRLAFETSFPPALTSVAAAIIYACTWKTDFAWNTYYCVVPFIPSLYLLSFVFCLQATRSRGRILSNSVGPALSDTNRANNNKKETRDGSKERTLPLSQINSWQAPVDWQPSMLASGELESFASGARQNQPFSNYAPAVSFNLPKSDLVETPQSEKGPSTPLDLEKEISKSSTASIPGPKPKFQIQVTRESKISIDDGDDSDDHQPSSSIRK
ncbi:hypothetical protein P389DRAFT_209545 [Cystobasidium minutum MCA 4210]|uniref:uncharacterized protein n=1 Tax=Cystobasidium minutum MCA 4210 TaxID=1397322 RepID=UPI0034CE42EA|eukprot:jgi/Rhomi1/209545/estExt_Genemark1.C_3_t10160